jgi:hypothetical protein
VVLGATVAGEGCGGGSVPLIEALGAMELGGVGAEMLVEVTCR